MPERRKDRFEDESAAPRHGDVTDGLKTRDCADQGRQLVDREAERHRRHPILLGRPNTVGGDLFNQRRGQVEEHLAACVNILPGLTSVYPWEGKIETGSEALLFIKTERGLYQKLETELRERHRFPSLL